MNTKIKRAISLFLSIVILCAFALPMLSCSSKSEDSKDNESTKESVDTSVIKKGEENADMTEAEKDIADLSRPDGAGDIEKLDNIESRTVMLYIVGSDLESEYGSATLDLDEIEKAGVDTQRNNIVVYAGGSYRWQNNFIESDNNTILTLTEDGFEVAETYPIKNMGDSGTLTEFIKYGLENFESDAYSLILWNHGAGPLEGYGHDEISGDRLYLSELGQALFDSGLGVERKLEFIGFDACLMSTLETAWMFRNYADYFVASQESEPGYGWDYTFLSELDECKNGEELGRCIVDYYYDSTYDLYRNRCDITLSCMDLGEIDAVEEKLEALFTKVSDEADFADISRLVREVKVFSPDCYLDLVDLNHFAMLLCEDYAEEGEALIAALEDLVVYNRTNVEDSYGVSIYHPCYNEYVTEYYLDIYNAWGFADGYCEYLNYFYGEINNSSSSSWYDFINSHINNEEQGTGREFYVQLDPTQQSIYASSEYYVLKKIARNEYIFVFCGNDAVLDENGVLTASYEGKAVYGVNNETGESSEVPLAMYQHGNTYYFPAIFFDTDTFESINAQWRMRIINGEPILRAAVPLVDDNTPQKKYLDPEDYDYVQIATMSKKHTTDSNGVTLPYSMWEETDTVYYSEFSTEEVFGLELRDIELDDDYYVFFEITDIYGDVYTSSLTEIK